MKMLLLSYLLAAVFANAQTMTYKGVGFCDSGYYAGWDGKGIDSQEACNQVCLAEPQCTYAAFAAGRTCTRYHGDSCTLMQWRFEHITYAKQSSSGVAITCRTTIDNALTNVWYNGQEVSVSGDTSNWGVVNTFSFLAVEGAYLEIEGHEYSDCDGCRCSGLLLECDNGFVSNLEDWTAIGSSTQFDNPSTGYDDVCESRSSFSMAGQTSNAQKIWPKNGAKFARFRAIPVGEGQMNGEEFCEGPDMIRDEGRCRASSCCHWNTWEEGEASFHGQGRCWSDIGNDICQDTSSPNDGYIVYNGDCPGSDIRNHPVETLDECKALCDAEPECLGFGRNDLTKSCWLKTIRRCGGEVVPTCPGNHCFYAKSTQGIEETCSTCRVRRSWNGLSEDEKRTYIDTVNTARREEPYKSQYDALVMSHGKLDSETIHGREQFLAWHRWFIYEYENLLRQITPCITVPYWAWEVAGSDWHLDEMWGPENYQFGTCMPDQPGSNWWDPAPSVNDGPFSDMILPGTDLPLSRACVLPDRGGRIPKLSDLDFLETSSDDFWSFFDGIDGVHRTVHGMIGGTMGSIGTAGMAPEFFLHHNNVDRIWAQWQLKSASHELAQSSRDAILLGTDQTYTVDDFTRPRSQAEICVEYDDHLADTSGRRRLSARTTKVNLAVAISNRLPKDVVFRNLLVHTNQLSIQVSEEFEAKQLMFAAQQKGDSLSEQRAHQIAHEHQENSSWGKYLKERKVDTEYKPDSEAKAFFADIVGITAESVRHALEVTHKFKRLQAFDRQWKELEQMFSEN